MSEERIIAGVVALMCAGVIPVLCWAVLAAGNAGDYGTIPEVRRFSPAKPTVPEVLPAVRALYARKGGSVGCCLHIVLDDPNYDDDCVRFCL